MQSALVIGNGLIGACAALELQRAGSRVTVLDVGDERAAASYGNAGHLATEQGVPLASRENLQSLPSRLFMRGGPVAFPLREVSAWLPFGLKLLRASSPAQLARGTQAMQGLLAQSITAWQRVAASVHAPDLIRADGHFVVWETPASAARGLAAWQRALSGSVGPSGAAGRLRPPSPASLRQASDEEVQALRARFACQVQAAARFIGTGQVVDLRAMRDRLKAAFEAAGGQVRHARVAHIDPQRAEVVLAQGERLHADAVVVAAGVGSRDLLEPMGCVVPMIAERGYHVEMAWDHDAHAEPRHATTPLGLPVVFEDRSVIVAPFASSLRISSFTEFARAKAPPDERKWLRLTQHAQALGLFARANAGLKQEAALQRWIGSRPTLPDYLPAIGQHPKHRWLFYAFGHNHLGVTLAAITGSLVRGLVRAEPLATDLTPFDLQRFA